MLRRTHKESTRDIALQAFREFSNLEARRSRVWELLKLRQKTEFKSVISALLIRLAFQLAMKLILHWIEQKFSNTNLPPAHGYQTTEPGYFEA